MLFLMLFILLLNVVAIVLVYYCLENTDKKDKIIFIAIGIAVMYMLTSFIYWISSKGIDVKEISETGKNLLTFLFVPINGILVLPIFAKSYRKYKTGRIEFTHLRNRTILLGIFLLIILIIECIYFKDIQSGVVSMLNEQTTRQTTEENPMANTVTNEMTNEITNTTTNTMQENMVLVNETSNTVVDENNNDINSID